MWRECKTKIFEENSFREDRGCFQRSKNPCPLGHGSSIYDLQFEPEEKTVEYLQKNEHQEILQMIEKRNILWNLNKNLTSEKIDKILLKI